MKKVLSGLLVAGATVMASLFCLHPVLAEVNVNIGIGIPAAPPLVIPSPPPVVVIPNTYVYFAPDVQVDLFFYRGYWYRPHQGRWYRAMDHNGPWNFIETVRVPSILVHLPSNYRHVAPGHERIPYGHLKKNWKTWEKERHWDKHEVRVERTAGKGRGKHKD